MTPGPEHRGAPLAGAVAFSFWSSCAGLSPPCMRAAAPRCVLLLLLLNALCRAAPASKACACLCAAHGAGLCLQAWHPLHWQLSVTYIRERTAMRNCDLWVLAVCFNKVASSLSLVQLQAGVIATPVLLACCSLLLVVS